MTLDLSSPFIASYDGRTLLSVDFYRRFQARSWPVLELLTSRNPIPFFLLLTRTHRDEEIVAKLFSTLSHSILSKTHRDEAKENPNVFER